MSKVRTQSSGRKGIILQATTSAGKRARPPHLTAQRLTAAITESRGDLVAGLIPSQAARRKRCKLGQGHKAKTIRYTQVLVVLPNVSNCILWGCLSPEPHVHW